MCIKDRISSHSSYNLLFSEKIQLHFVLVLWRVIGHPYIESATALSDKFHIIIRFLIIYAVQLTVDDHFKITEYLRSLNTEDLIRLGGVLGLHYTTMEKMKSLCNSLVLAWLNQQDNVMKRSGKPTWESLMKALRTIGHKGVARAIMKGNF